MFDLVVRHVAALAAAPALFALSAPAMATGPIVPQRPQATPPPVATPTPRATAPAVPARAVPAPVVPARAPIVPAAQAAPARIVPARAPAAPATVVAVRAPAAAPAPAPARSAPAARTTLKLNPAQIRARSMMVQVLRLTNTERRTAGCPALTVDGQLINASLRQSNYMARTRLFSHVWRDGSTFVDRSEAAGYQKPAGENIAWGYRSAPEAMDAWMASPGHRKNILNCKARSMGAGVAYAADGTPYYTQVFGWQ